MKKILSVLMAGIMLFISIPQTVFAEDFFPSGETGEAEQAIQQVSGGDEMSVLDATGGSGDVTRLEWLKALTTTFEMSVEEDNYPDNYFTDIDASSPDYYDVMLATEFGLVDVEAGDPLCPDDPATREFVAHTLNLCLGFLPEENMAYTFSEAADVTYPVDIQVAINHGWLALSNGDFLPEQGITASEKDAMIAAAKEVLNETKFDANHVNTYEVLEGVIVVPEAVEVYLTDDNELTFYDYGVAIAKGDIFVVTSGGMPVARRAKDVTITDNKMVVQVESVDTEEAFTVLDVQGTMDVDLTQVQAVGAGVSMSYIVGGTPENEYEDGVVYDSLSAVGDQEVNAVIATKTFPAPCDEISPEGAGTSASFSHAVDDLKISCKISDFKPDFKADLTKKKAYIKLSGTVTFTLGSNAEGIELPYFEDPFVKVPLGVAGYIQPSAIGELKGSINLTLKSNISTGVEYANGHTRLLFDFQKEAFTLEAKAEVTAGVKLAAGLDYVVVKGELYFTGGAKGAVKITKHLDGGLPERCSHLSAHLFVNVGAKATFDLIVVKEEVTLEKEIYNEANSPVKIAIHYEDGKPVSECTRDNVTGPGSGGGSGGGGGGSWGPAKYKYYTPFNSQYAYNGVNKGTGSDGKEYAIFEYSLNGDEQATITKYNGNVSALNIPETIDGYTVVGIGSKVFQKNQRLQMVNMPDTVTSIGTYAFAECSNLQEVGLSSSLLSLGDRAFNNCDSLENIEIPKSLKTAKEVFRECDNLKTIYFEEGTTRIVGHLFAYCTSLEKIEIPSTVTSIGEYAFCQCSNLKQISLSDNLATIGKNAFEGCKKLEMISIPDYVTTIGSLAFYGCSALEQVTLSKRLETIGYAAFGYCSALTEVEIPKSVDYVPDNYLTENMSAYPNGAFYKCDKLKKVTFEEGTTDVAQLLFAYCSGLEEIVIPDTVTRIEYAAFYNCVNLKEVTFSKALTSVAALSFYNCKSLEKAILPDGVNFIGAEAFCYCDELMEAPLPKKLETIGYKAFAYCDKIKTINIPKSLKKVTSAFNTGVLNGVYCYCDGIETVEFEDGIETIPMFLFNNCGGIRKLVLPETVKVIESSSFTNFYSMEEIILPEGLTKIESNAFENCEKLKEIIIPDSVTTVNGDIFRNCIALEKVQLPDNWTIIYADTFYNCRKLKEVNFPKQLKEIRARAFYNCTSLENLEFPDQLSFIGIYAFYNCAGLKSLILTQNIDEVGKYAFCNCTALEEIEISNSVNSLGDYCFCGDTSLKDIRWGNRITIIPVGCFLDCSALTKVELPYSVTTISEKCFVNDTALSEIILKGSVTSIASNAFSYPDKITLYGVSGSYVEKFAEEEKIQFIPINVQATELSLNTTNKSLFINEKYKLIMSVAPEGFTDAVTWKSSNESVATVNSIGDVVGEDIGEATIRVMVGDLSASCKVTVVQPVTKIYFLNLDTNNFSMEALETFQLKADVWPIDAANKAVEWSTSNEEVAIVSDTGLVTAVSKGTATITVRAKDGSGVSRSCTVTVTGVAHIVTSEQQLESEHNYANDSQELWKYTKAGMEKLEVVFDARTEVEEDFDFLYIYDGDNKLIGTYTGKELAGKTVSVPGDTVIIKLVADKAGNAWGFKVTSIDGTELPTIDVTGVKLNKETATLEVGKTEQLTVTVVPADATNQKVIWSSSNTKVATVENGLVTAVAEGTATITVTTEDGNKTATCVVKVKAASEESPAPEESPASEEPPVSEDILVTGISLNMTSLSLLVGGTAQLTALVEPEDAANKEVVFSSGNPSVATVDSKTGLVTAVGEGKTTIRAVAADGSTVSGSCEVTVKAAVEGYLWIPDISDYTYTGTAIIPDIQVYFGSDLLIAGRDYTVNCKNNTKAASAWDSKAPTVTVTGKGNYSGTAVRKFNINPLQISGAQLASSVFQKGKAYTPVVSCIVGEDTVVLKVGTDYRIEYDDGTSKQPQTAGEHTMTVIGKGNCEGTATFHYTVGETGMSIAKASAKVSAMTYGGELPTVSLKFGGEELTKNKDYIVVFSGTGKKGTGKATFVGIGEYFGSKKVSFKVNAAKITSGDVAVASQASYEKGGARAAVTVKVGGRILVPGVDYTVKYSNNKKMGATAKVTVTGKGNYSGTVKNGTFNVVAKDLNDAGVKIYVSDAQKGKKAAVTIYDSNGGKLSANTDYKVSVDTTNHVVAIETGKNGLYRVAAPIEIPYREVEKGNMITSAKLKKGYTSYAYNGEPIVLKEEWLEVKAGKTMLSTEDIEIVGYVNNVEKGTAIAVVRAKETSGYGGVKFVKFKISAYSLNMAR